MVIFSSHLSFFLSLSTFPIITFHHCRHIIMAKNATQRSSVNIWPSQEFRSTASDKKTVFIPTRLDHTEKGERHIVLWEDVQQAFKGAQCIMDGNVMVPFVTDKKLNRYA